MPKKELIDGDASCGQALLIKYTRSLEIEGNRTEARCVNNTTSTNNNSSSNYNNNAARTSSYMQQEVVAWRMHLIAIVTTR